MQGNIIEDKIYSQSLQENIELITYLPPSYSPLNKYNILIAQDGLDYFSLGRIATIADELHMNNEMENTIIIGIPYNSKIDRYEKYHPNGKKNQLYIRFLAHELVSYLDNKLPTYQIGSSRILIGDSLAGTVSLMTALSYPHTFGKVIIQSPMIDDTIKQKMNDFRSSFLLEIYHIIGDKETEVKTTDGLIQDFLTPNRKLKEIIKKKAVTYHYYEYKGDHSWEFWQPDLKRALQKMMRS